jgi:hypothetical protein
LRFFFLFQDTEKTVGNSMYFTAVRLTTSSEAGLHLLPNSVAISFGSLGAGYIMRYTGRFWWLTTISATLPVLAFVLMSFLDRNSPALPTWLDITPSALGFSCIITSTLGS